MVRRSSPDRDDSIGAAYRATAERLHQQVAYRTTPENRHLADDACAFAWTRLVDRVDIDLDAEGRFVGWLYTVARRELLRLIEIERNDVSLDSWNVSGKDGGGDAPLDKLPGPDDPHSLVERREQLRLLEELAPVRRQTLMYQAVGYSYEEIGELLGLSPRQVRRHLSEGVQRIRELQRERSHVARGPPADAPRGTTTPRIDLDPSIANEQELGLDL